MKERALVLGAAALLTAGIVHAEIGSVISTFRMSGYTEPRGNGIYRDGSYVYGVMHTHPGIDYLYRFTVGGSLLGSVSMTRTIRPHGADRCHLGAAYLCIIDPGAASGYASDLFFVNKTTGSVVMSFAVFSGWFPRSVTWDGTYYYAAGVDNEGVFTKYTPAGSNVGSWKPSGWPSAMTSTGALGYAAFANGLPGSYLVASARYANQPSCIIDMADGSLVATFTEPFIARAGGVVGDSSRPGTYGAAYWICKNATGGDMYAVEIDIDGRNETSILPASLGKVKAIYR
jgi:hypothetical protein